MNLLINAHACMFMFEGLRKYEAQALWIDIWFFFPKALPD